MRLSQPMRATQLKIQASSAWAATWRLIEKDGTRGIDADSNAGGGHLARRLRQLGRVLPHRDGMHVHHAIEAGHALLQPHPILHRPEIIPEVKLAGGLNAGKNQLRMRGVCHGGPYRLRAADIKPRHCFHSRRGSNSLTLSLPKGLLFQWLSSEGRRWPQGVRGARPYGRSRRGHRKHRRRARHRSR